MGEEAKKPDEEKKAEEPKKEEETKKEADAEPKKPEAAAAASGGGGEGEKKPDGEAKEEAPPPPPPPPPEEIVMRVYMHCEGCARKVQRCLKGFDGVEEVKTDCRTHKVVVKGLKAAADPMKVVERVQKKSGRKVELLTPLPPPPKPAAEVEKKEEEKPKVEEKKEEPPPVIVVVLKVHMHCEACAQEIRKRILKMKGVQSAEPDLKASQVTVKGVFDAAKLVEYVYKRTGKHAAVVKQDPAEKPPEPAKTETKDEKKAEGADDKDKGDGEKEGGVKEEGKKEGGEPEDAAVAAAAAAVAAAAGGDKVELRRNEYYYYPRYGVEYNAYPPQIFSDENPNACSVM